MAQVKGKIAKIIDESTVILNVGAKDGVTSGMRFVIYEEGEEVQDPDTGDSLGAWEVVKGEVAAKHVQERINQRLEFLFHRFFHLCITSFQSM